MELFSRPWEHRWEHQKPEMARMSSPDERWHASVTLLEQPPVVDLGLVEHHVAVGVSGDGEVALPHQLADPRPGDAAQVQQRDAPVA
jgi:hypothetical protein